MKKIVALCFILLLSGCVEQKEEPVNITENTSVIEESENIPEPEIETINETINESAPLNETEIYDENGRLTDYARSFRPEMFSLDFNELETLYPEEYGSNYYEPGNYTIRTGDGFGKGDFLIKFVEFIPQNESIEGQIRFEVFRKENDGNYYHYPTEENAIIRYGYTDIYGITMESPAYSWEINTEENNLVYHPDCTVYFDGSGDCSGRCDFDALPEETKVQNGKFSAIYPEEYNDTASFSADLLEQCYYSNVDFLGYDTEKPRVGIKVCMSDYLSRLNGGDEAITLKANKSYLDWMQMNLEPVSGCTNYLRVSHELTHIMTKEVLGKNFGFIEGLAEFVEFHNNGSELMYICEDNGWHYKNGEITPYANLSYTIRDDVYDPPGNHYATGFCFWKDFTDEYGYPKFVLLMQELQQKGRGAENYYVMHVMEEITGEPLSEEITERYSLTRDSTYAEICHNCELIFS